jgi:hypothetical protein
MNILRTFALEVAEGALPNTELLELSMAVARPSLDQASLASTVVKLKSHPCLKEKLAKTSGLSAGTDQDSSSRRPDCEVDLEQNRAIHRKSKTGPSLFARPSKHDCGNHQPRAHRGRRPDTTTTDRQINVTGAWL